MTEIIKGNKKNGNQWQFISDENDIEIINKKLDWIAKQITILRQGLSMKEWEEYNEIFKSNNNGK